MNSFRVWFGPRHAFQQVLFVFTPTPEKNNSQVLTQLEHDVDVISILLCIVAPRTT